LEGGYFTRQLWGLPPRLSIAAGATQSSAVDGLVLAPCPAWRCADKLIKWACLKDPRSSLCVNTVDGQIRQHTDRRNPREQVLGTGGKASEQPGMVSKHAAHRTRATSSTKQLDSHVRHWATQVPRLPTAATSKQHKYLYHPPPRPSLPSTRYSARGHKPPRERSTARTPVRSGRQQYMPTQDDTLLTQASQLAESLCRKYFGDSTTHNHAAHDSTDIRQRRERRRHAHRHMHTYGRL
jgi:hypothetical protein